MDLRVSEFDFSLAFKEKLDKYKYENQIIYH